MSESTDNHLAAVLPHPIAYKYDVVPVEFRQTQLVIASPDYENEKTLEELKWILELDLIMVPCSRGWLIKKRMKLYDFKRILPSFDNGQARYLLPTYSVDSDYLHICASFHDFGMDSSGTVSIPLESEEFLFWQWLVEKSIHKDRAIGSRELNEIRRRWYLKPEIVD